MGKCVKCQVEILDHTDRCPLCRHVLKPEGGEENMYPDAVAVTRKYRFLENLVLFLSLVVAAVLASVNYAERPDILWSPIVILILFYGNIVLRFAVIGRSGYMFKTLGLTVLAVAVLFCIDWMTGYNGWSLDYVLPGGILLIDLGIFVLMWVNHRNWQSYMMAQLLMVLLSLIPLILLWTEVTHARFPAQIAAGASVFLFLGTLILGDERARTELKRRFHI